MKINAAERALGMLGGAPQRMGDMQRNDAKPDVKDVESANTIRSVTREAGLAATQTVNARERSKALEATRDAEQKDRIAVRSDEKRVEAKQERNVARDEERAEREADDRRYDEVVKGQRVNVMA